MSDPILVEARHDFNMPDCHIFIAEGDTVLVKDGEGNTCQGVVVGEQRIGHRYAFKVDLDYDTWRELDAGDVHSARAESPTGQSPSNPVLPTQDAVDLQKKPARKPRAARRPSSTG